MKNKHTIIIIFVISFFILIKLFAKTDIPQIVPIMLLLICPLMMVFMMKKHH